MVKLTGSVEPAMDAVTSFLSESPLRTLSISLATAGIAYFVSRKGTSSKKSTHSYPPGPPQLPILGALTSFPGDHFYQRFSEWAELYGDIVHAPIPGMNNVIINSHEVAQEILSKKPQATAGRRVGYFVLQLMGWHWLMAFIQPTEHHANQRKMLRRSIGPQGVAAHDVLTEPAVANLMPKLATYQGDPVTPLQSTLSRVLLTVTYGEKIWDEMGDKLLHWNLEASEYITKALFSFWFVDIFHFLRFIPDWVPGLPFKTIGRESSYFTERVRVEAYKRGLELYKSGTLGHSLLNDFLEEFGDQEDVQDALATLFFAGSDTGRIHDVLQTIAAVTACLHNLFLYPKISKKIYEEIQSVTHGQRLPTVGDRPRLPYTEAFLKESIRWNPFAPLSIPHVNEQDEVIRGYFIPKGTLIHQNLGYMMNDPKVWGDPEVFRPERFLEAGASERPNPLVVVFGYGMRTCPGMYLAERTVLLFVTNIISLFELVPCEGKKIPDPATVEYDDRTTRHPIGFECRFVIRDEKAQNLLKSISIDH
ncbi:cytochrome P450 [Serendipita vermifera]|nr:cytochrome P450 [Serendipita vermifera]